MHVCVNCDEHDPKKTPKGVTLSTETKTVFRQVPSKWPNVAPRRVKATKMELKGIVTGGI